MENFNVFTIKKSNGTQQGSRKYSFTQAAIIKVPLSIRNDHTEIASWHFLGVGGGKEKCDLDMKFSSEVRLIYRLHTS